MALPGPTAESVDLESLLKLLEIAAVLDHEGHLTIMRFTAGWKVMLGTPDLRTGDAETEISRLEGFTTLNEAVDLFTT